MIDWRKKLRNFLLNNANLYAVTLNRIYAADQPDNDYSAELGIGIVFGNTGGFFSNDNCTFTVDVTFRIYSNDLQKLVQADKLLYDALNFENEEFLHAGLKAPSTQVTHPTTKWLTMISNYRIVFNNAEEI